MTSLPRIEKRLYQSDRDISRTLFLLAAGGLLFVAAQWYIPDLPQLETIGTIIASAVAVAMLVWAVRLRTGTVDPHSHSSLRHLPKGALERLERALGDEPEVWGDLSFTSEFMITSDFVPYLIEEIELAHRRTTQKAVTGVETKHELFLYFRNGKKEKLWLDVSEIEPALDCLRERSSTIRVGYDPIAIRSWEDRQRAASS